MLDRILDGVDRALAYKLMLAHIIIIAFSNYLVQFKFSIFGAPLAAAAFTDMDDARRRAGVLQNVGVHQIIHHQNSG